MMRALLRRVDKAFELAKLVRGRVRAASWSLRGAALGPKAFCGAGSRIEKPWCVRIGQRFVAEDFVYLKVVAADADLRLGDYVFVGRGSELDVLHRVTVGSHTVIAPGCFITDHNHGIDADRRIDDQPCEAKAVAIGSDVWLGANVTIVAGVSVGDGAVVAANAVVTQDVPPMAVVAGVPARVIRYRGEKSVPPLSAPRPGVSGSAMPTA